MWRWARRVLLGVAALIAIVVVVLVVTPQGRAAAKAALFIPQVLPDIPVTPLEWITGDPVYVEVSYPLAEGEGIADLYLPAGSGKHSAVLFFQGVVPGGRFDSRMVGLAEGLARSGMAVMVPWSDTQVDERVNTDDIDNLVRGFQYLSSHERVDPDRVGMGGICVGASLSLVAAQDDRIKDQVNFVNFFAGYYDAFDFVRAIGSRSRFGKDYSAPWETDKLVLRVFKYHLIEGVASDVDRAILNSIFFPVEGALPGDPSRLTDEGDVVYRLLKGVPIEEVDGLMAKLSPATNEFLTIISPSTHIDKVKARVLIMHDLSDKLVPSEESRRLAEALEERGTAYHTEFSFFQNKVQVHKDESTDISFFGYLGEAYKLYMHMYNIMRDVG